MPCAHTWRDPTNDKCADCGEQLPPDDPTLLARRAAFAASSAATTTGREPAPYDTSLAEGPDADRIREVLFRYLPTVRAQMLYDLVAIVREERQPSPQEASRADKKDEPATESANVISALADLLALSYREDIGGEAGDAIREAVQAAKRAYDGERKRREGALPIGQSAPVAKRVADRGAPLPEPPADSADEVDSDRIETGKLSNTAPRPSEAKCIFCIPAEPCAVHRSGEAPSDVERRLAFEVEALKVQLEITKKIATEKADELARLRRERALPGSPDEDLRDADLDRLTARECFEYLSRGLEGGEAAILKAVAMTRAHERRKRR